MVMKKRKNTSKSIVGNKVLAWGALILFLTHPIAHAAGVTADPNAPLQNKPTVETGVNGVTIVQITNPSAAGVSRNLYQQFNVDPRGLILNNSQTAISTQLAGLVQGNIYLADGSARVILNEVTSTSPSFLRGYTEVAGQRAEVIIANPNGITGDGFGFINTSRAVLTTGAPTFGGNGSLDAFRVAGGKIAIQGAGMDASKVDQVDLISRAIEINGKISGKNINGIAGLNTVNYKNLSTEQSTDDGNKPQVAIDVGMLGGMYAQKIYLVGTEQGVGVNSKGTMSASDDIRITSEGKVLLSNNNTTSGGNLYMAGKEGVTIEGAQVKAGADAQIVGSNITLTGSKKTNTADTVDNTGGKYQHKKIDDETVIGSSITAEKESILQSTGNILIEASDIVSKTGDVSITADKDITLKEMSEHHEILEESHSTEGGLLLKTSTESSTHTVVNSVKGSSAIGENVSIHSGNNLTVQDSKVVGGSDVSLTANQDMDITTAQETREFEQKFDQTSGFANNKGKHDHVLAQKVEEMGSVIGANRGAVMIAAGNHNTISGSDITSGTGVQVTGQDIVVAGGSISSKTAGVSITGDNNVIIQDMGRTREVVNESHSNSEGIFSHNLTENQDETANNDVNGSTIVGDEVSISSGKDMTIKGSNVMANKEVSLTAKGDLTITTAQKLTETDKNIREMQAGISLALGKEGVDLSVGVNNQSNQDKQQVIDQIGSNVVSNHGKVTVAGGTDVKVAGSSIMSAAGTDITGQNISVEAVDHSLQSQQVNDTENIGLHITAGNKVINAVSDSVNTAVDYFKKGQDEKDIQTKAIDDARAGTAVLDAAQAVKQVADIVKDLNVGINVSGGIQNVKKTSEVTTAQGSKLVSDADIHLTAKNNSDVQYDMNTMMDGNIHIIGSNIAGKNVVLTAANDVDLQAGINHSENNTCTIGGTGEVGVKLGFSNQSVGVNVGVGASINGGKGVDTSTSYTHTTVNAGDNLQITSGRDVSILGAQARGDSITASVGRNLNLESVQEKENNIEGNGSLGGTVNVDAITTVVNGSVSGKVSGSYSDYKSVTEQSGIIAGKGGFDIHVGENTNAKGAIIASNGKKEDNKLSTNTLSYADIDNKTLSVDGGIGGTVVAGMTTVPGFTPDIDIPGFGKKDSTTQAAIVDGMIEVRSAGGDLTKLNRKPEEADQTLDKTIDAAKVQEQKAVIKDIGEKAIDMIKDLVNKTGKTEVKEQVPEEKKEPKAQ